MKGLRLALLGLALVVFAALGWRLTLPDQLHPRPKIVASAPATLPPGPPPTAPVPIPAPVRPTPPAPPAAATTPAAPPPPSPTATPPASSPPNASPPPSAAAPGAAGITAEAARTTIMARLDTAPDLARVFDLVRAEFPAAADRSLGAAVESLRGGGSAPSPDDFVAGTMRDLRLSSGVLAARAGPDALAAIFDAKAATLADLEAADPRICADYVYGGASPEFSDFAIAHRALVARADLATITAMADGRARQMRWETPSAQDYAMIEAALKAKGLSADEIGAVLDGKSLDPPPSDTRLCDNARAYLDAMRGMPAEARNRVYGLAAELLARS